jgi:hypothetical protein
LLPFFLPHKSRVNQGTPSSFLPSNTWKKFRKKAPALRVPACRNSYRNLEWPELVLGLRQSGAGTGWEWPSIGTVREWPSIGTHREWPSIGTDRDALRNSHRDALWGSY